MTGISVDSFIQRAGDVQDLHNLVVLFEDLFAGLNFETISYHLVRQGFRSVSALEGARVEGESGIVESLFAKGQSIDFDPALSDLLDKLEPFHWFDAEKSDRISDNQKAIFAAVRAEGFVDGIAVPVMTRPGELALFVLSKRGVVYSLSDVEMRKLQIACHAMHLRFEELLDGEENPQLSVRETDVMRLVARGKTNREIAAALNLSAHTIDTLIRRCFSKLDVSNRIEASIMFTFRDRMSA